MNTREKLISCVREFEHNDESITISKVAERCGVSHSLIYNRHPDIKEMFNNLKKNQKEPKRTKIVSVHQSLIDNQV
ncbi:TetR/AcrR family transcriptional regulator [Vibrio parahaemolyticus]